MIIDYTSTCRAQCSNRNRDCRTDAESWRGKKNRVPKVLRKVSKVKRTSISKRNAVFSYNWFLSDLISSALFYVFYDYR